MRTQRLALALSATCLLGLFVVLLQDREAGAKRVPSVLRARTFELVDSRGKVRAQMKVERTREVVFRLRDHTGAIRVKLGAGRTGSGLLLLDENTEPGVQALAGARATTLRLQRGERRTAFVP